MTLQYKSRQDSLLGEELYEEKLTQLLEFVSELAQTPPGAAELQCRVKTLGECKRLADETASQFYARLRHWLDKDLPRAKLPLHARQMGD